MASPLIASLSATARKAYPIIQRGVAEGLSSRALQSVLANAGLGIRRQTLLDVMRAEQGMVTKSSQLQSLGMDRTPNPDRLPEALTKQRRQYSFRVQVGTYYDVNGEESAAYVSVATDSLLTRAQIEEKALAALEESDSQYGVVITSIKLVGGTRAGPAGVL